MTLEDSQDALRRDMQATAFKNLIGTAVSNPALTNAIMINRKGLKHCISRRYPNTHQRTLVLADLPALLVKATYLHTEPDNHIPPRPGVFIHKFETTHEIAGTLYNVWLYVRETPDLMNFYDLGVVDMPVV